jgi:hypothetical protein
MSFLNDSLANLISKDGKEVLPKAKLHMIREFVKDPNQSKVPFVDDAHTEYLVNLLSRKGVYMYDYMDSFKRFEETQLPAKTAFYSKLGKCHISAEDYAHAQQVWTAFNCQTIQDYHDLYLKTDVLLLADVFENFRTTGFAQVTLDPCHYVSLPGYSWDALHKLRQDNKEEILELFNDTQLDMYQMAEKGIRGGVSMARHRFARANNPRVEKPSLDLTSFLLYLDANNLYGWAMSQPLPLGDFKWDLDTDLWTTQRILDIDVLGEHGWLMEVDLDYPRELHKAHSDYPLAVESIPVTEDMLSPYMRDLAEATDHKLSDLPKLIPNLRSKQKYVVHSRNLQFYLQQGLVLTKVHRVLQFRQLAWMKPYIDFCTALRTLAKNDFEKDFWKLMVNAVFGKSMENVRGRIEFGLVTIESNDQFNTIEKWSRTDRFKRAKIFSPYVVGLERSQTKVTLNKPIIVGCSILDISKVHMYDFHYNTMKKNLGDNCKLLYTDTDSLIYQLFTADLDQYMVSIKDQLDLSNYPKNHPLYSLQVHSNKKVPGKFKDENAGRTLQEAVMIKAKCYSLMTYDWLHNDEDQNFLESSKKNKGTTKAVVKNELTHQHYLECLSDNKYVKRCVNNRIGQKNHWLSSMETNKIALCSWEDKMFHVSLTESYPYGFNPI